MTENASNVRASERNIVPAEAGWNTEYRLVLCGGNVYEKLLVD